jgi:hypothetical protein
VGIPALHSVLEYHAGDYPDKLLDLCEWLHWRGADILYQLIIHKMDDVSTFSEEDWTQVCLQQFSL